MPYIGRDLNRGNYLKLDDISSSFNGSTQTFNLTVGGSAFIPGSAFSILVSVGGVIQEPESAYQVNNSEITFANAPTAQDGFFCIALAVPIGIGVPGNGTVNGTQVAKPFNYDGYFYLDDANNRVGIGSLQPKQTLDIIGNTNISGILTASTFNGSIVGNINNPSGISTFYDLRVSNNLTVEGSTTTLDTNLIGVDRVEVGANSNTVTGIAVTQSGTADLVRLYDGASQVVTVDDVGNVGIGSAIPSQKLDVDGTTKTQQLNVVGVATFTNELRISPSNSSAYTTHLNFQNNGTNFISHANGGATHFRNSSSGETAMSIQGSNRAVDIDSTLRHLGDTDTLMEFGDNTITFDTAGSERIRIMSGGAIGIHTTTGSNTVNIGGAAGLGVKFHNFTSGNSSYITVESGDKLQSNVGGTGYFTWVTGGSEKVRFANDGKVGIGTDAAGSQLSVGRASGNGGLTLDCYGTNRSRLIFRNSVVRGTETNIDAIDDDLRFVTGSGERLRITSIGDLLLGNHGSRIFDDSSGTNVVVDIYGGTTAGKRGILALGGRSGSDDADLGTIQFLNENNNLATAANHIQSKLVASIDVKSETTDSNAGSDSGGHLLFSTKPETGSLTERLRIASDGTVHFYGNQTSAPEGDFGFRWDRNSSVNFQITNTNNTSVNAGAKIALKANVGNIALQYVNNGGFYINNSASGYLHYYTGGTSRLYIDTSGNVNINNAGTIGTSNGGIGKRFGIKSTLNNIIIGETTNSGNFGLILESRVTGRSGNARSSQIGLGNGLIDFYTAAADADVTKRLEITSGGNVTIKTNDVTFGGSGTLRINSGSTAGALNLDGGASNHGGEINLLGGSNGGRILFRTGQGAGQQTEKMRLNENGSLRIGDAATVMQYAAHSEGDDLVIGGSGWRGMTIFGEGGGGVIQFADNADNRVGQIMYNHSDNSMMFRTNGNVTRLSITSAGQVQIPGGTTPFKVTHTGGDCAQFHRGSKYLGINADWGGNTGDAVITASTNLVVHTNGSNERLRITSGGNVGIQTSSPESALHVRGGGGIRIDTLIGTPILSNSNVVTDGGGNPYLSGTPWFTTGTYTYNTSNSPAMDYFWIKIVESMGGTAIGYIEYMCHSDSNYPRSVHGRIDVAKYASASLSISHNTTTPSTGITPEVVVDSNQRIWIRMNGAQWNSDFRFRLVYAESVTVNSDFTIGTDNNSAATGRMLNQDATPLNASGIVESGATLRWADPNTTNPPKYWSGSNSSTTAGTYGDSAQTYGSGQHRFVRIGTRGRVDIKAGWNDHALLVESNYIGVNNQVQPVLAVFKSQKTDVAHFNRMYTQGTIIQFKQNNDNRGYFNNSGTTTTYYDQGSDERLKTNIEEWTEKVLPHFKAIKPKKFNWIEDADGAPKVKGFIAQENLDKFPEAYHLNKDDRYWFSKSEMVPYLMKALQEEIEKREEIEAKYNALEARISALESNK